MHPKGPAVQGCGASPVPLAVGAAQDGGGGSRRADAQRATCRGHRGMRAGRGHHHGTALTAAAGSWAGALARLSPKQIGVPTVTGQSGPAGTSKNTTRLEALTVARRPAHWLLDTQDIWLWLTLSQELSQVPSPGTCPVHTPSQSQGPRRGQKPCHCPPPPLSTAPPWSPPWTLWAPPQAPEAGGSVWGNAPSPAHQGSGVDRGLWQLRPGS